MKKTLISLVAAVSLLACSTTDKKSQSKEALVKDSIAAVEKAKALNDSANYTTIQWVDSTFKDLGKAKKGGILDLAYRFKNTGTHNLVIGNVTAQCGCTIPEKPEKPIAPGEEGVIKAKFNSEGKPLGEVRKEIYVTANTNPNSHTLTFRVELTN